jgi:hypothetical protein
VRSKGKCPSLCEIKGKMSKLPMHMDIMFQSDENMNEKKDYLKYILIGKTRTT